MPCVHGGKFPFLTSDAYYLKTVCKIFDLDTFAIPEIINKVCNLSKLINIDQTNNFMKEQTTRYYFNIIIGVQFYDPNCFPTNI